MKDTCYIVVNSKGINRLVRKARPTMKVGEYAVRLELTVPDHVFQLRPVAQATLEVQAEKLVAPIVDVTQIDAPPPPAVPLEDDPDFQAGLREG